MSIKNQETIADIVAEMLEFADTDSQTIGRDVLRRRIQHFARRFEAAAKREREAGADAAQICGEIGEECGREHLQLANWLKELVDERILLKVAEDALRKLQERLVASVHDGTMDPHEALKIAEDAIAAIREKGANNGK